MTPTRGSAPRSFTVDDFIQSITQQLDQVQDALALKVKTGRPLTWALKDLTLDLKVVVEVGADGLVTMRSAGSGDDANVSSLHLTLSTITRSMVEENTYSFEDDTDLRSLDDVGAAAGLSDEQRRKLGQLGVRTIGQLKRLGDTHTQQAVQSHSGIPVNDLMRALQASSRPTVLGHSLERGTGGEPLVRIRGANLYDGVRPEVKLCGEPVEVLDARPAELLVRPRPHHSEGQVEVLVGGHRCTGWFRAEGATAGGTPNADPYAEPWGGRPG